MRGSRWTTSWLVAGITAAITLSCAHVDEATSSLARPGIRCALHCGHGAVFVGELELSDGAAIRATGWRSGVRRSVAVTDFARGTSIVETFMSSWDAPCPSTDPNTFVLDGCVLELERKADGYHPQKTACRAVEDVDTIRDSQSSRWGACTELMALSGVP